MSVKSLANQPSAADLRDAAGFAHTAREARRPAADRKPFWHLRRPRSLQVQLFLSLTLVLVAMFSLGTAAITWRAVHTIDSLDDRSLQLQARDISHALSLDPRGKPVLRLPPGLAVSYKRSGEAYLYVVLDEAGRVLFASDNNTEAGRMLLRSMPPEGRQRFFDFAFPERSGRYVGYSRKSGPFRIGVAQASIHSDAVTDSLIEDFLQITIIILLPTLLVTSLVSIVTIRRSLGSIRRVSAAAHQIGPTDSAVRLSADDLPSEILPLVDAFNLAVDRLAAAFQAQRQFTADAAHELRTPLAVLMAHLDSLPDQTVAHDLRPDVKAMARVVDQLLSVARLEAGEIDRTSIVDLRHIAETVVRRLAPLAIRQGRTLGFAGDGRRVPVRGDADAISTALVNLVENAIIHTPAGSEVDVAIEAPATLRVSDRGPGIPAEEREQAFRRFGRGTQKRGAGAGIGLAIVSETMRAHGGTADIGDRPGGGCVITLAFPPADGLPGETGKGHAGATGI